MTQIAPKSFVLILFYVCYISDAQLMIQDEVVGRSDIAQRFGAILPRGHDAARAGAAGRGRL